MIRIDIEKKIKTYEGKGILKVHLECPIPSNILITGPSGSGKTTLLKIIAGILRPEKGKIQFEEAYWLDTEKDFTLPIQQRNLGFVFQNYALFPNMTLLEHLKFGTRDGAWIEKLLTMAKMETLTQHKPDQLSGGQQQRLSLIRALSTKPRLLLMDEPFSALDRETKTHLIPELKRILEEINCTNLLVSHNPEEHDYFPGIHYSIKAPYNENRIARNPLD